ncbi:glycosyltransferase family 2 protein [Amylibacter sp.]|nr:glycosyltransferase family 2 protein [Amylibacter sp.]
MKLSILILTLNEQNNITDCIQSVKSLTDDIVVLDSESSDETPSIAQNLGAKVVTRKFTGWASHQNWALKNIDFKYDWVLYVDADERVTPELTREIKGLQLSVEKAYKIYRDNRFLDAKPLKFSMRCPGIVRLFSVSSIHYEREINPVAVVNGPVGRLKSKLVHYNFSKGLDEWILKHLDYAKREALEFDSKTDNVNVHFLKKMTKNLRNFRFLFRLFYQLFFKMGLLDGYVGFRYAVLVSFYEHLIEENMT